MIHSVQLGIQKAISYGTVDSISYHPTFSCWEFPSTALSSGVQRSQPVCRLAHSFLHCLAKGVCSFMHYFPFNRAPLFISKFHINSFLCKVLSSGLVILPCNESFKELLLPLLGYQRALCYFLIALCCTQLNPEAQLCVHLYKQRLLCTYVEPLVTLLS